jgi:hypothetical protein
VRKIQRGLVTYKGKGKRKMGRQSPRENEESSSETATEQSKNKYHDEGIAMWGSLRCNILMMKVMSIWVAKAMRTEGVVESEYKYIL